MEQIITEKKKEEISYFKLGITIFIATVMANYAIYTINLVVATQTLRAAAKSIKPGKLDLPPIPKVRKPSEPVRKMEIWREPSTK